ncbi:helix-turn-helix domain-containing protein [Flavobacterium degerlachei]|jgi:AraC-like DNA-binding protein|uniref:Transcriptional regulator, AraC family n=1 Tax=Flavobacterium degerlachei TaxID=229203 RepID=A0A1H3EHH2_9FLAO|nr:helix-turn-helix domain-containing protein [Flavobacterium degerlachei]SDX77658.1 transcriptional regulator, AraC family [Flavobacterium degerlachei]
MKLYIKNMVCGRCEMAVKLELERMKLPIISIKLGEVNLSRELTDEEIQEFSKNVESLGFELLEDEVSKTIAQIKNGIIDLVHYRNEKIKINLSSYLSKDLRQDYSALSKLFSEREGITIEHYFIAQKIEKVKELLVYDELSLSEIAIQLNYSNVAHLSNQFKKVTGFTPTYFKKVGENTRKQIDSL